MNTETKENHAISNARGWLEEIRKLVQKIEDDGLTDDQIEEARQEIQEGPLSVMVRDGWRQPGAAIDSDNLQWQDWGTPWTDYPLDAEELDAVASYARCFYFAE